MNNPPDDCPPEWAPMPGGLLELGSTGFVVELCTDPAKPPYLGRDPEGRYIAAAISLDAVKDFLVTCSAWRREFDCDQSECTSLWRKPQ